MTTTDDKQRDKRIPLMSCDCKVTVEYNKADVNGMLGLGTAEIEVLLS